MDEFTTQHLSKWLDTLFPVRYREHRDKLEKDIIEFVTEYPDLLQTHSWPEIHRMIIRNKEQGIGKGG